MVWCVPKHRIEKEEKQKKGKNTSYGQDKKETYFLVNSGQKRSACTTKIGRKLSNKFT